MSSFDNNQQNCTDWTVWQQPKSSPTMVVMSAREPILDSYERLLIEQGERAATLTAVAESAGVSKGGLLYHFPSKSTLVDGLIARVDAGLQHDLELMATGPREAIEHFVRSSFEETKGRQSALALQALAQTGDVAVMRHALGTQEQWLNALTAHGIDPDVAKIIQLVGDGFYWEVALVETGLEVDDARCISKARQLRQADAAVIDAVIERLCALAGV